MFSSPSLEEVRGKRETDQRQDPTEFPLSYIKDARKLYLLHSLIQRAWSSATVDDEWKKAEGVYIPKEKDSNGLNKFRPISLLNVEGENIFLHYGIEAHGVRDVEAVRRHFSPKGSHSRCTRLYRAYLDDLGGYPESQEEPAESVSRMAGLRERIRVSATLAPMKNIGGPSCAIARCSHPSGIL